MPAFSYGSLSSGQISELAELAMAPYANFNPPSGWSTLQGSDLGGSFSGGTFTNGNAAAEVYRKGNALTVSFRGTDSLSDAASYPSLVAGNGYINNFDALLNAVATDVGANGISQIFVTGHSLGAAAANILRNVSATSYNGAFNSADFVTFATPKVSTNPDILNVGYENDWVYKAIPFNIPFTPSEFVSTADHIVWYNDLAYLNDDQGVDMRSLIEALVRGSNSPHAPGNYISGVDRILSSDFYSQMSRDSIILLDATDLPVSPLGSGSTTVQGPAFFLGETAADIFHGGSFGDFMEGLAGNDFMEGRGGSDDIRAGTGNDEIVGGTGNDTIDGGTGTDVAYYHNAGSGVNVTLNGANGTASGGAGNDLLRSIEDVVGSNSSDRLTGSNDANLLVGQNGNDTLIGNGGHDTLMGGAGADVISGGSGNDAIEVGGSGNVLTGGSGEDTFVFNSGGSSRITDFQQGQDCVVIDRLIPLTFSDLTITQVGSDVRVKGGLFGPEILFNTANAADFDAGDFVLI